MQLRATATDAQDGTLPSSALSFTVLRHHDTHTDPYLGPVTGNTSQFDGSAWHALHDVAHVDVVAGLERDRERPDAPAYAFGSWSDGGARSHVIVTPSSARTYTATYRKATP